VTDLFVTGADRFGDEQIAVFDDILGRLVEEIETQTLARISRRLAPLEQTPVRLVHRFADDANIEVAGPMLRESPRLGEAELAGLASRMGPPHLLAISQRAVLPTPVTDILVVRGDHEVLEAIAVNQGARFSASGYDALVKRAVQDNGLAETVARRNDLPPALAQALVGKATEIVRQRLVAVAPEAQEEIHEALAEVTASPSPRRYQNAQRTVLGLLRAGRLDELRLYAFARDGKFEETVASLSALARLPIAMSERIIQAERLDPLLIVGRAIGVEWPTLRALIMLRAGRMEGPKLEEARANFERLSGSSAERVLRFWRDRATIRTG
jgi:uncharacterized protein (DUF2336 family)